MARLRCTIACLALTLFILPSESPGAMAQSSQTRPQTDAKTTDAKTTDAKTTDAKPADLKTLGGQFKDLNEPGSLGPPLPPPPVRIEPTDLNAVSQFCGHLKEAGASPGYCK